MSPSLRRALVDIWTALADSYDADAHALRISGGGVAPVEPANDTPGLYAGGVEFGYGHTDKRKGQHTVDPITGWCDGWGWIDLGDGTTSAITVPTGDLSIPCPEAPYTPAAHDGGAGGVPLNFTVGGGQLIVPDLGTMTFTPWPFALLLVKTAPTDDHMYLTAGDADTHLAGGINTGSITDDWPATITATSYRPFFSYWYRFRTA